MTRRPSLAEPAVEVQWPHRPASSERSTSVPVVLDVSRLVWRRWKSFLPTGIDRVCLAYLDAFAPDARAMLQWKGRRLVLREHDSQRLFALLREPGDTGFRRRLAVLLGRALLVARIKPTGTAGHFYLNVGHTGLDADGLDGWLTRGSLRAVYLVHDLIPIRHPAHCRPGEAAKHAARMRTVLRTATVVIVNSAATRAELARFAAEQGHRLPRTVIAHLGVETLPDPGGARKRTKPYFLCVGTIEARKNHLLLLRLWDRLRADLGPDTPDLVLVGRRGWEAEAAFELLDRPQPEFGQVVELAACGDVELAGLLDGAVALLMPSLAEGFGLPVFEAMSRGVPVIASDLPVFRELTHDIPLLLDPNNEDRWEQAVRAFLQDRALREEQRHRLATFAPPEWASHMAEVHAALTTD